MSTPESKPEPTTVCGTVEVFFQVMVVPVWMVSVAGAKTNDAPCAPMVTLAAVAGAAVSPVTAESLVAPAAVVGNAVAGAVAACCVRTDDDAGAALMAV